MSAQVKLQWSQTTQGTITQEVYKKEGSGDWLLIGSDSSVLVNSDVPNGWYFIDTSIAYSVETVVTYRVMTNNGTYSLPGNEVSLTIGATPIAVSDLTAEIEVV